jgi:hypothetical protein
VAVAVSAKGDLAAITEDAERAIDRQFARLVPRIGDIVRHRCPDGRMTWDRRRLILRDVDALLDGPFGPERGAPSALGTIIGGHASVAYGTPQVREAARLAPVLRRNPDLAAAASKEVA